MTTVMRTIPFGKPIIDEAEKKAVVEVLDSPMLVHGPKSKQFEAEFALFSGAKYALSLSSCTAGLHLSYFNWKIGPGDEVIVPAQTHVATVHAVEFVGATPVFVDADPQTGNIAIDQIESKITTKTKAISVVHFLGFPVAMDQVVKIAKKHNLKVVEDCALAFGTKFQGIHAGLHGDLGCFSFYPVKHMTTAEGGMLITQDEGIAKAINLKKAFGVDRVVGERKVPGYYDVVELGFNYRMNEIESVIGIEQLKKLPSFLEKRKENYHHLYNLLSEIDEIKLFSKDGGDFQSSYYCLSILLNEKLASKRTAIIESLKNEGVGTSIYYPQAVPEFTYYREKYGYKKGEYPEAAKISNTSIALPVGPHLNLDDMDYIVKKIKAVLTEVK